MSNTELAARLFELSKINYKEDELLTFADDMEHIIGLMDMVKEFKPSYTNDNIVGTMFKELRADNPCPSYSTEDILKNAKERTGNCFAVPKVV